MFALDDPEGRHLELTSWQLVGSGYRVIPKGECIAELAYEKWKQTITCSGSPPKAMAGMNPSAPIAATTSPPPSTAPALTVVADSEYASRPWRNTK